MTHTSDTHTYTHTAPSPCIADPAAPFSACSGRPGAETPAGVKRCLYAYRVYLAWHAPDSVAGLRVCKCRVQVVQMPRSSPRLCSCTRVVQKCSLDYTASFVLLGHLISICAQASSVCTQTPMGKPHSKCAHVRMHANIHADRHIQADT